MFTHRIATEADIPGIAALMERAIDSLQSAFLNAREIAASRLIMGLDTQLIADRTYFVVEEGARLVGCGGWSRRATLYGGDHAAALRDARLLDPATDAAKIRAMYTDPDCARRGIGRFVLSICENAARDAGFARVEMMATLSGEQLYLACGYHPVARVMQPAGDVEIPGVIMGKPLS
ncbi:GNAT family N-acetyltransferase [soil metagenome]